MKELNLYPDRYCYLPCHIPQFQAVLDNPDLFLTCIEKSIRMLCQPIVSEPNFFSAIDQGFLLNEIDIRNTFMQQQL